MLKNLKGKIRVANGKCPAGHSLMSDTKKFDRERAIAVVVKASGQSGMLYLNPFYGKFDYEVDIPLNQGDVIEVFCPECQVSLMIEEKCNLCDIHMFAVHLPDGGQVEACPKVGCQRHALKIVNLDEQLERMYVDDLKYQM
jgi:hypothetical protein